MQLDCTVISLLLSGIFPRPFRFLLMVFVCSFFVHVFCSQLGDSELASEAGARPHVKLNELTRILLRFLCNISSGTRFYNNFQKEK